MARRPPVPESRVPESETSRLIELVRSTVPPMHPAGFPFVVAGLAVAAAGRNHRPIRTAGLIAAGAAAVFFRHPPRVPPGREGVVVAPADGQISVVDTAIPPAELGLPDRPLPRVSIFLSLFDPHVQRVPVGGEAVAVCYRPGAFFSADRPRSSEDNERNSVLICTSSGSQVAVVQIAGLLARRIECEIRAGDRLSIGDTYGLIRFGSRVDTYLPEQATVLVLPGQRAVSAETVLAELP